MMKTILTSVFLLTLHLGINDSVADTSTYVSDLGPRKCHFQERAKPYNGWSTTLSFLNEGKEFALTMALPRGEPGSHSIAMSYVGKVTQISENKLELYEVDGSLLGKLENHPNKKIAVLKIIDIVSEGTPCSIEN